MTVIAMVIGNINNATAFVPRRDRKEPLCSPLNYCFSHNRVN